MDLLRHLTFFVTVAEERHFGRAARRLGMAQPPLSQGVRRLEDRLGVRLLDRGAGGVAPTAAGRDLLPRARALLEDAETVHRVAQRHAEARRALHLGVVADVGPATFARLAARITRDTGLRTTPTTGTTVALVDAVAAGTLDVAVVGHPAVIEGARAGPVVALETDALVPADHPAAASGGPVAPRALRDLRLATPPRAHAPAVHDLLLDTLDGRGCPARPLDAADPATALALVATGAAFVLTPDPDLRGDGVRRLAVAGEAVPFRVRIVHRDDTPSEVVDVLSDALRPSGPERRGDPP